MFDTMQAAIARYRLASYPPDILIDIPDNICETHEFYKASQLIAAGRFWAGACLDRRADQA
jgi:NTE family protein